MRLLRLDTEEKCGYCGVKTTTRADDYNEPICDTCDIARVLAFAKSLEILDELIAILEETHHSQYIAIAAALADQIEKEQIEE